MLNKFKREIRSRKFFATAEEATFYAMAAEEVDYGKVDAGLHAMALSKSDGDEIKARAKYLQLRADVLKQEVAAAEKLATAAEREAQKAEYSEFGITFMQVLGISASVMIQFFILFAAR